MKPAPFEPVTYVDPTTKNRLVSKPADGMAQGTTRVFDAKGKELWSMQSIVGCHRVRLSPSGETLLLTGNFYFGDQFHLARSEPVASVYERGALVKKFSFADVSALDPESSASSRNLRVKGGNWVRLEDFVAAVDVDWHKRTLSVRLFDGSVVERPF